MVVLFFPRLLITKCVPSTLTISSTVYFSVFLLLIIMVIILANSPIIILGAWKWKGLHYSTALFRLDGLIHVFEVQHLKRLYVVNIVSLFPTTPFSSCLLYYGQPIEPENAFSHFKWRQKGDIDSKKGTSAGE